MLDNTPNCRKLNILSVLLLSSVLIGMVFVSGCLFDPDFPSPGTAQTDVKSSTTIEEVPRNPLETGENGIFSAREIRTVERSVIRETNNQRTAQDLESLKQNNSLAIISDYYAWKMWSENFYSHISPEGNSHGDRLAMYGVVCFGKSAENIAHGPIQDLSSASKLGKSLVNGWMDSPSHREAILTAEYSYIGVGVFVNDSEVWAVQLFCERIEIEEGSIADRRGEEGQERIPSRQHSVSRFQAWPKSKPTSQ